jgi:hypothetical protein
MNVGIGWGLEGLGGSDDGLNESLISSFVPLVTTQKSPRDKFKYSNDIQGTPLLFDFVLYLRRLG